MNKVFVFDIDGTLLNGNLHLTDCVLSAINHIKGKGCKITIATGRSALWSIPILDKLQIGIPYISSGGACIKDPVNNNIFFQNNIDKSLVYQLLELAYKKNIIGVSFQNITDVIVDSGSYNFMRPLTGGLPMIKKDPLGDYEGDIVKIDIQGQKDILGELGNEINTKFPLLNVAGKRTTCLEITNSGVNKGSALLELLRLLKIDQKDVIVFGNGDNDIPMFRIAGLSIAMGNSPDEVKAQANIIAPTNDEEGVAWAIERVMQLF